MTYIKKGWGFHVEQDFSRAPHDIPAVVDPTGYARPGHVIAVIDGDPNHPLTFMRPAKVRVHVRQDALGE